MKFNSEHLKPQLEGDDGPNLNFTKRYNENSLVGRKLILLEFKNRAENTAKTK